MPDGSKYVGGWQAGKRHGQGRCMYASGDQYEGQWEEDVRHGQGGCIYASGDKYKGTHAFVLSYTCTGSVCQRCATRTQHVLSQTGFPLNVN